MKTWTILPPKRFVLCFLKSTHATTKAIGFSFELDRTERIQTFLNDIYYIYSIIIKVYNFQCTFYTIQFIKNNVFGFYFYNYY